MKFLSFRCLASCSLWEAKLFKIFTDKKLSEQNLLASPRCLASSHFWMALIITTWSEFELQESSLFFSSTSSSCPNGIWNASLNDKEAATDKIGSKHPKMAPRRTIFPVWGSIGSWAKCKPKGVSCSLSLMAFKHGRRSREMSDEKKKYMRKYWVWDWMECWYHSPIAIGSGGSITFDKKDLTWPKPSSFTCKIKSSNRVLWI